MFDLTKTINLLRGGLLEPQATWDKFLGENPDLQKTFFLLTGPLVIVSVVLNVLLSKIFGGFSPYTLGYGWFMGLIMGLIMAFITVALATVVFTLLAGVFGGKADWNRGFAAVSLAMIPGYLAGIVGALIPWVGGLVYLAGIILGVVFLYKIMPLALAVPEGKRPVHFIVAIVCLFIANMIVASVLGLGAAANQFTRSYSSSDFSSSERGNSMFSELERQGKLLEAAENDRYNPPANGKLSEDQVEHFIAVLKKSRDLQKREEQRLEKLAKDIEDNDNPSIGDISRVFQGVGSAVGMHNAEMEVVKTGNGNWAEHQWVREQLRIAMIQQDTTDATKHNYKLYQKFEEQIGDAI